MLWSVIPSNVTKGFLSSYMYSEKATKFCEISTNYLSYYLVKWLVEISKNFVSFSEYMNFNVGLIN